MKNLTISLLLLGTTAFMRAQDPAPDPKLDFDSKYRFGLRITPQPTWFVSGNKNSSPAGALFGFGFGLNMEYRFSNVACLLTGIGGDFEGGRYKVKYETGVYQVRYWLDESSELIEPSKKTATSIGYELKERKVRATYATIPLILKLSTQEYSGIRYFGMLGVEVSYRVNASADDTYSRLLQFKNDTVTEISSTEGEITDINLKPETLFMRMGMNAGLGAEYRVAGTTSVFASINFFRSFTNFMREESDYMYYSPDPVSAYRYTKTNLKLTGIRFNVGILF